MFLFTSVCEKERQGIHVPLSNVLSDCCPMDFSPNLVSGFEVDKTSRPRTLHSLHTETDVLIQVPQSRVHYLLTICLRRCIVYALGSTWISNFALRCNSV